MFKLKLSKLFITTIIIMLVVMLIVCWVTDQLIHHLDEKMPF